jgi:hypothetical protein
MQPFASNKILAEEFFVFDDQKEIEFPNDNAAEIAENIKMIDPYYNEYEVIVNVLGKNKIAISPIQLVEHKLKIKNQYGYKVRDYSGTIYVQNRKNLRRIVHHFGGNRQAREGATFNSSSGYTPDTNPNANSMTDYSKTNIQTEGVDEGDIVKTDGKYIYFVNDKGLTIIDSNPLTMKKVFELKNKNYGKLIRDIFLDKNKLIIISDVLQKNIGHRTFIETYDISDIKNPKLINENNVNGEYNQSRKKGERLYVITNDHYHSDTLYNEMRQYPIDLNDLYELSNKFKLVSEGVNLEKVIYMPFTTHISLTVISSIPLYPDEATDKIIFTGDPGQLYMSNDNIYTTSKQYALNVDKRTTDTEIRKFAIEDKQFRYVGKIKVEGKLLNQFSMGEENGVLFVAHSKPPMDKKDRENIISSFNENMKKISSLRGIAPKEKIYSARFVNGKAYIVTFRMIDPLFVVDIKNPSMMKILGQLKIPGYSNYLHPYSDKYLIGFGYNVGQDIYGSDIKLGYKISLFDVSDYSKPKELSVLNIGEEGSYSYLGNNHKMLMFDSKRNIFALPIFEVSSKKERYSRYNYTGYEYFYGAFVIQLSDEKLKIKGKISHSNSKNAGELANEYNKNSRQKIQRIVQIGDNIYTLSHSMLKVNDINTMEELKTLKLD